MSMKSNNRASSVEESYSNTNFWGIDGHKNSVKRLEDGATLCDEFMKLVLERADIEMKYTLKLREWSKRWNERINGRISEYGSMLEVMKCALREAEDVAEIHVERHNRLKADVWESVKHWKNQNYHKSMLKWKEVKECESGFAKIYEPWARRYNKMDKAKRIFHRVAKASENASLIASNAEKEGSMPDKVKKAQDHDAKLKAELEEARKKYERRISELNASNDTYASEMEAEFVKWEKFERIRLVFFKDALQRYHNVLDIAGNERLTNIYQGLLNKVRGADENKDLKWWSTQYGPGMPKKWPEFEEPDAWNPQSSEQPKRRSFVRRLSLRRRGSKRRRQRPRITKPIPTQPVTSRVSESLSCDSFSDWSNEDTAPDGNFNNDASSAYYQSPSNTLRDSTQNDAHYTTPSIVNYYNEEWNRSSATFTQAKNTKSDYTTRGQPIAVKYNNSGSSRAEYDPSGTLNTKPVFSVPDGMSGHNNYSYDGNPGVSQEEPAVLSSNPFEDGDEDYYEDVVENEITENLTPEINGDIIENERLENAEDAPAGIAVRAKYDYAASEDDELSFNVGDIITQLSDEDGQGWCKGRLNGVEGLFPAKWVEAV